MSNNQEVLANAMRAITISREYGSGGGEIARRLAERLHWQLIDHEVVVRVANALGVSENEVEAQDEYAQGTISRILSSMRSVDPAIMIDPAHGTFITTEESYNAALVNVVQAAVRNGHVVIVGRGSQKILADRRDVLHVRVVAPLEERVTYVMQREGVDRDAARERIVQKDRQRERYLQTHYHENSANANLYDLAINTGIISLDNAISLICTALVYKAARLLTPKEQLGPAAGSSTRYPGRPEDFRSTTINTTE